MRLSRLLAEAVLPAVLQERMSIMTGGRPVRMSDRQESEWRDVATSLARLAKYNQGSWKSEKQARFLRDKVDHHPMARTPEAKAFAKKYAPEGAVAFPYHEILRYPHRGRPGQYMTRVYIVDDGGVVAAYKMNVDEDGDFDWGVSPKSVFKRKGTPAITVDTKGERAAAARENEEFIEKIHSIPNWGDVEILRSFMGQMSRGRKLSDKQKATIEKFIPDPQQVLRNQPMIAKIKAMMERSKLHWGDYEGIGIDDEMKLLSFISQLERGRPLSAAQKKVVNRFVPKGEEVGYDKKEWIRNYSEFKKLLVHAMAEAWEGIRPVGSAQDEFDAFVAGLTTKGYADDGASVDRVVFDALVDVAAKKVGNVRGIYGDIDGFEEMVQQYEKGIKAKNPTFKSIRVMNFIANAVEKLKSGAATKELRSAVKERFDLGSAPEAPEAKRPSAELKRSMGGYTVPSPAQMGFAGGYKVPSPSQMGFQG